MGASAALHARSCTNAILGWHDAPKCGRRAHSDVWKATARAARCALALAPHEAQSAACRTLFVAADSALLIEFVKNRTDLVDSPGCARAVSFAAVGAIAHPSRTLETDAEANATTAKRLVLDWCALALAAPLTLGLISSTFSLSAHNILAPWSKLLFFDPAKHAHDSAAHAADLAASCARDLNQAAPWHSARAVRDWK